MRFLVMILIVGTCTFLLHMAQKIQANPQAGSGVCTFGKCQKNEICCDGNANCPTNGFCAVPGPSGSFGGTVGTCMLKGKCLDGQQCCFKAMKCPKSGICP